MQGFAWVLPVPEMVDSLVRGWQQPIRNSLEMSQLLASVSEDVIRYLWAISRTIERRQVLWQRGDKGHKRLGQGAFFQPQDMVLHYHGQKAQLQHCLARSVGSFRWLAMVDLDEFLVPHQPVGSFNDFIRNRFQQDVRLQAKMGKVPLVRSVMFRNTFFCSQCIPTPSVLRSMEQVPADCMSISTRHASNFMTSPSCPLDESNQMLEEVRRRPHCLKSPVSDIHSSDFGNGCGSNWLSYNLCPTFWEQLSNWTWISTTRSLTVQGEQSSEFLTSDPLLPYFMYATVRMKNAYRAFERSKVMVDPMTTFHCHIHSNGRSVLSQAMWNQGHPMDQNSMACFPITNTYSVSFESEFCSASSK
jgi:hypothetical protein